MIVSRIAGYKHSRLNIETYRYFTLLDFKDNEINEFIQKWYPSHSPNETEGGRMADDMLISYKELLNSDQDILSNTLKFRLLAQF